MVRELAVAVTLLAGCEALETSKTMRLDVVNQSAVAIVVSVASDTSSVTHGFLPGDRGTITIDLGTPDNGIGVEILRATDCAYLVEGTQSYATPVPLTLVVGGGPQPGSGVVVVEDHVAAAVLPLPQNALRCPGG